MPLLTRQQEQDEAMRLYERRYRADEVATRLKIPKHRAEGYLRQYESELTSNNKGSKTDGQTQR